MKKFMTMIWNTIQTIMLLIIVLIMAPIALINNLINGVSPKTVLENVWYCIQVGKEENDEEL